MALRNPTAPAAFLLLAASVAWAQQSMSTLHFESPEDALQPASIAHDPVTGDFFLGSMRRSRILRIGAESTYRYFLPHPAGGAGQHHGPEGQWGAAPSLGVHRPIQSLPGRPDSPSRFVRPVSS